ncbi:polymorphic toxin-type HINT domain-containing protein [Lentzea sp. NPDC055074]
MDDNVRIALSRASTARVTVILVTIMALVAAILGTSATVTPPRATAQAALDDRAVAVELLKTGGRATKSAAEAALLGSDDQLREFVATGQHAAIAHDNRLKAGQIMAVSGRRVREAAQAALGGTPEDVRKFLAGGWQEPHRLDLRAKVGEIMAANGPTTQRAAQAALEGTAEDVLKFIAAGQYSPAVIDRRKKVGGIMANGGTEVNKAAQIALSGSDDDVQEFLATGQHTARARDNEQASITELVNLAKAAGTEAALETEAAKEASARAVAAAEQAKQAALVAAAEAAAAKDDAAAAAAAAGRAADFASRAASAAQEAVAAANSANNAARVASNAAMQAAAAASAAAQAASDARGAAADAATDANQAANARIAAQKARDVAAGARLAADASKAAGEAASQAAGAARSASSAGANADRAASAAEDAANQAGVSGAEAERARRAAADAHRFAAQANRAATNAESLANQSAKAAGDAYRAAIRAAEHAENAARAADEAAAHAGEADKAATESEKHAIAAQEAAAVATQAAELADQVEKNARTADSNRLQLLQDEGVAAAEKAKAALENKAAWEAGEASRIDQETQRFLDQATAPNADSATMLSNGRQAALRLRNTGGPWTQSAAEMVLSGGEPEMLDYLETGREEAAEEDDRARVRYLAESTPVEQQKIAAQQAFLGDGDDVREFLKTQYYDGKVIDDRKKVGLIISKGGPATQRAGQKALESTPEAVREFLAVGQYDSAALDDRMKIGEIISAGGPETRTAGQIALAGPRQYARDFVQTGQFKAAQRDSLNASHIAAVRRLVAEAARIAATARENAAEASRVAAVARNAADQAAQWAERARQSATEAAEYARQAQQSAKDAQASADQAAESARSARAAADAAARDAEAATLSATKAEGSAAQARASAADAASSAQAAKASELAAGRDAALAQEAADDAYEIAKTKQQDEQRAVAGGPLTPQEQSDLMATCNGDQACVDKYNKAVADANLSLVDFLKQEGAEIILEMIGYNDAVKCFTQGDVEACIWTAINALSMVNPIGLLAKGGKLVAAIAKIAGKVGKFLKRSEEAKSEVKAGREAIHEAMRACKLKVIGSSFAPTTRVLMADGTTKAIKDVVVGDQVAATDPETGKLAGRPVGSIISGSDLKQMVSITVGDDTRSGSVEATGNHPFWVVERQQWVDAGDIKPGEHLQEPDSKPAKVVDVRSYTQVMQVYNLTVEGLHTYYVVAGDIPVLVHNAGKDRFSYLDRPGYSNYVLKDADGKIYYSGMFGGKQTQATVEKRHSRNRNRYSPADGDTIEVQADKRTYGESRLLEQRLSEKHGTYIGRDGDNYRGNRQNPLVEEKRPEYEGYEKRLKQIAGEGCP